MSPEAGYIMPIGKLAVFSHATLIKRMASQQIESPIAKAWKRLKKNYPAMVSFYVIVIAIILAIIAPAIAPDKTQDANDQVLEITNESPGFTTDMLLVRKNRPIRKSNVVTTILRGRDNPFSMVPVNSYSYADESVIVDVYRGERYASESDTFSLVDVIYPLSIADFQIQRDGQKLSFSDFNENRIETTISELRQEVEEKHIKAKTYRLGTDKFGRDILSRLMFGLRVSISVGFIAVFISLLIGITLGATAGYFRNDKIKISRASAISVGAILGLLLMKMFFSAQLPLPFEGLLSFLVAVLLIAVIFYAIRKLLKGLFKPLRSKLFFPYDDAAMLIINVVWSIPTILLAMALSFSLGTWIESFWVIYIAVGLSMWVEVARIVRGQVMSVREMEYVQAARSMGFNNARIIARHILPNIIGPIMVIMAANFAAAILIEAGRSFIGIGVQPPKPSWGIMLSENRNYLKVAGKAFLALAPGISIMILVLAFNLLGKGLRDAFDVKGKES
jgi:peptide/nickel transport system permease protein